MLFLAYGIIASNSSLEITGSLFAYFFEHGAISAVDSNVTLVSTSFIRSSTTSGASLFVTNGLTIVRDCKFEEGVAITGGAIRIDNPLPGSVIEHSTFTSTYGARGGAIYLAYGEATISNCTFYDCGAGVGGAIYAFGTDITIEHCQFTLSFGKFFASKGLFFHILESS